MAVSALPVEALRAQLAGNSGEHRRLLRQFSSRDERVEYSALVHAGFLEAAARRFPKDSSALDVIQYIADIRGRSDEIANAVNPEVGEQLILEALGRGSTEGADTKTSSAAMLFLLTALVADENLDTPALNAFIIQVRKTADYLLGADL